MSDQWHEPGPPPPDEPANGIAPPPAAAARRRPRNKTVLTAMAGVLAIGAVGFGIVSLIESDGAASAEDAVKELFEAVDRQDAIGVAESLEPTERRILVDALEEASTEARRVEVTDDGLDLRAVDGVELSVDGLELQATPLDDETYAVDITSGQISSRTQLSRMPIGPVVQEVIDRNEEVGEVDDTNEDEIELAGTRLVAVKRGGEWYVSALFSLAEQIRLDLDPAAAYPPPGSAIPAVGADSPEAVVREGVAAAVDADIRRLIELTPADEARVLHTYGPILAEQVDGGDTGIEIDDLELEVTDAPGGRKHVSATSLTMTTTTDWDRQVTTYDGECSTTTVEVTDPDEYGYGDGDGDAIHDWTWCDDDTSMLSPFAFFNVFYAPGSIDVIVEEHDGRWFLSPASTVVENTVGTFRDLDVDQVRRMARVWGGEWWLADNDELWKACGIAQPTLDTPRAEAESAYSQCIDSLPDDYGGGTWGPVDGAMTDDSEGTLTVPGNECYGAGAERPANEDIDACLAELVASGDLDPAELASFRCGQIFDEVTGGDDLSEAEYEAYWDDADERYQACMDEAASGGASGGGNSFGPSQTTPNGTVEGTPTTTEPRSTTATSAPAATTSTTIS